jgi:hypothetical protein
MTTNDVGRMTWNKQEKTVEQFYLFIYFFLILFVFIIFGIDG